MTRDQRMSVASQSRGWTDVVAGAAGAVTVAGMIATPLLPQRSNGRRLLSSVVVGGMFMTTTANAIRRWGAPRAAAAALLTAVATGVVERVGTRTGMPFGRYAYTAKLQPQIAHVPVIVPLAWFAMGLPSREVAHCALGPRSGPASRIVLGSLAMTAWDLFLDPQMVGEGYWAWARRGAYRGIPLTNFVGWFVTGLGIMALFDALLPVSVDGHDRFAWRRRAGTATAERERAATAGRERAAAGGRERTATNGGGDVRLVGQYGYISVMQTLGFARYFRDPVVATVGGGAMLPIAGAAVIGLVRRRGGDS